MNSVEDHLRVALRKSGATSKAQREVVYEHAIRAAKRIKTSKSDHLIEAVLQAIRTIEDESTQTGVANENHETNAVTRTRSFATALSGLFQKTKPSWQVLTSNFPSYISLVAVLLFVAIPIYFFLNLDFDNQKDLPRPKESGAPTSAMELVTTSKFPADFDDYAQNRPKNATKLSLSKVPDDTTKIDFDVNFLSSKFFPRDPEADYLLKLKIDVPNGIQANELLPVLNAGFLTYDSTKKAISNKSRFLLVSHKGRIHHGNFSPIGNQITFTGVALKDGGEQGVSFDPDTHFFKVLVGIRMATSSTPIELRELQVQKLN